MTVTDRGNGILDAVPEYDTDGALFVNSMTTGELEVTKTTAGASSAAANTTFSFTLDLKDANGNSLTDEFSVTGANETTVTDGGTLTLTGSGTFKITGLPHGTQYTVTESDAPGWRMTDSVNTTNTITGGEKSEASFENTYSTGGSVKLTAKKEFLGGDINPEQFRFILTEEDGTTLGQAYAVTDGEHLSQGDIEFAEIAYTIADDGAEHIYVIREQAGTDEDVIYDLRDHRVKVAVSDNGDGTMSALVTYLTDGDEEGVVFTNLMTYPLTISKTIGGTMGDKTRKFDYTITLTRDGSPYTDAVTAPSGCDWSDGETADDGVYTFKLGHEQSITLTLPYGVAYAIAETEYGQYVAKVSVNGGTETESLTASGTITQDTTVAYVNELDGSVPTLAVDRNLTIYCLGLSVVCLGALLSLRVRRRKYD